MNNPNFDISKSTLNINAAEFIPSRRGYSPRQSGRLVTETIKSCIRELSEDPGEFNEIIDSYLNRIIPWLDDYDSTERLAIGLTDLCIQNSNCRYIGVKLAHFIHGLSVDQMFLNSLLKYCKAFVDSIVTNPTFDKETLQGFTIYIGELYVQMEVTRGMRSPILKNFVLKICTYLFTTPDDKNIMLVVNLLKLVGQSLQIDGSNELDKVIQKLHEISKRPDASSRTRVAILKVVKTHEEKWGLLDKTEPHPSLEDIGLSEATFYGPDGQVMSTEEQRFLDSCMEPECHGAR